MLPRQLLPNRVELGAVPPAASPAANASCGRVAARTTAGSALTTPSWKSVGYVGPIDVARSELRPSQ